MAVGPLFCLKSDQPSLLRFLPIYADISGCLIFIFELAANCCPFLSAIYFSFLVEGRKIACHQNVITPSCPADSSAHSVYSDVNSPQFSSFHPYSSLQTIIIPLRWEIMALYSHYINFNICMELLLQFFQFLSTRICSYCIILLYYIPACRDFFVYLLWRFSFTLCVCVSFRNPSRCTRASTSLPIRWQLRSAPSADITWSALWTRWWAATLWWTSGTKPWLWYPFLETRQGRGIIFPLKLLFHFILLPLRWLSGHCWVRIQ